MAQAPTSKVVFVLIDGLGDVSSDSVLGGLTPLQKAHVPHFDLLAKFGLNGLMDPCEPGLACGSDTAHLNILGYPPRIFYRGRGAFESMGAGLDMKTGDIAFKSNFATLDPKTNIVVSRRADKHFHDWGQPLCPFLSKVRLPGFPDVEIDVQYATEHRCGVRLRGPRLSDAITGTDPLKDGLEQLSCKPTEDTEEARRTCQIVNELNAVFTKMLTTHKLNLDRAQRNLPLANLVLFRGAGCRIQVTVAAFTVLERRVPCQVPTFRERHGYSAFVIAPTAIIGGLGISLHMDRLVAPGATGDDRTDLQSKARTLLAHLAQPDSKYNFGFLHVKAVDDASHDGNHTQKVELLEKIDRMVGTILTTLLDDKCRQHSEFTFVLTGDHSTPASAGDHSCEPVPLLICPLARVPASALPKAAAANDSNSPQPAGVFSAAATRQTPSKQHQQTPLSSAAAEPNLTQPSTVTAQPQQLGAGCACSAGSSLEHKAPGQTLSKAERCFSCFVATDRVTSFDEVAASAGVLGRFSAAELMRVLKATQEAQSQWQQKLRQRGGSQQQQQQQQQQQPQLHAKSPS